MKRERNICEVQGDKVLRGARNRVQIRERKGRRRNKERRRGRGSVIFHTGEPRGSAILGPSPGLL